jgi:hypothetical protein
MSFDFNQISPGKLVCIFGPRCSGKTTLANHLSKFVANQHSSRENHKQTFLVNLMTKCSLLSKELIQLIANYSRRTFTHLSCTPSDIKIQYDLATSRQHSNLSIVIDQGNIYNMSFAAPILWEMFEVFKHSRITKSALIILVVQYVVDIQRCIRTESDFWFCSQSALYPHLESIRKYCDIDIDVDIHNNNIAGNHGNQDHDKFKYCMMQRRGSWYDLFKCVDAPIYFRQA